MSLVTTGTVPAAVLELKLESKAPFIGAIFWNSVLSLRTGLSLIVNMTVLLQHNNSNQQPHERPEVWSALPVRVVILYTYVPAPYMYFVDYYTDKHDVLSLP